MLLESLLPTIYCILLVYVGTTIDIIIIISMLSAQLRYFISNKLYKIKIS